MLYFQTVSRFIKVVTETVRLKKPKNDVLFQFKREGLPSYNEEIIEMKYYCTFILCSINQLNCV